MTTLRAAAAGVSRLSRSASRIVSKAASGFHLLRVEAYTQTKRIPSGQSLDSAIFDIGGCRWYLKYYPNGRDSSTNSDYISLYLRLYGHNNSNTHQLQAQYKLTILDQAGNFAHGPPATTAVFNRDGDDDRDEEARLCGHDHFIRREELERRDDLLKDNCVVFLCDVDVGNFTELNTASLACEDGDDCAAMCDDHDNDEFGLKPREPWEPRGPLRPNDTEFVQWCLAQKRMGRRSSLM